MRQPTGTLEIGDESVTTGALNVILKEIVTTTTGMHTRIFTLSTTSIGDLQKLKLRFYRKKGINNENSNQKWPGCYCG